MKLLALDTSSVACSVALRAGNETIDRHEERPREHTRLLLPMIRSVLNEAQLEVANLDAIVLGNGPGSFIGMRIAASVAQGLAYACGLKIVAVSSMAGVASEVFAQHDAAEVVVAQDAHMQEVYLGRYRRDGAGLTQAIEAERLCGQEPIAALQKSSGGPRIAAGFGWHRYPELWALNRDHVDSLAEVLYPRARFLLDLGISVMENGHVLDPQEIVPAYLRQKVAEKPARIS